MMKYIFTLVLFICLTNYSEAQDSTITLSRFEVFTSQPNRFVKKEIRSIGNIGWEDINIFKSTDPLSNASVYAVRMGNFEERDMPRFINPFAVYIDFAELDTVLNVLNFFLEEIKKPKVSRDMQLSYTTTNDIEFSAYYNAGSNSWRISVGKVYKQLRTYVPGTFTSFNSKRLAELIGLLQGARSLTW